MSSYFAFDIAVSMYSISIPSPPCKAGAFLLRFGHRLWMATAKVKKMKVKGGQRMDISTLEITMKY